MYDILIQNAVIVDGTGSVPFLGDVAVKNGKVCSFGSLKGEKAHKIVDAKGRYLTPGFIDIHRHADLKVFSEDFGRAELFQGITTCISGNCGMSAAPCAAGEEKTLYGYLEPCLGKPVNNKTFVTFKEYVKQVEQLALPMNFGNYVGSGTVRIAVKGFNPSPMSFCEMETAKALVREAMEAGAFGLSMGIMYSPECNYSKEEMVEIAQVVGRQGGILVTHIRGEGDSMPNSVAEVIEIAEKAEIPLHISHLKAAGRNNWDSGVYRAFEMIEAVRSKGQDVTCDAYPYEAGSTMLITLIPPEFLTGGMENALEYLKTDTGRSKLRCELLRKHKNWDNLVLSLGWDKVVISSVNSEENQQFVGCSIAEIATKINCDEVDAVCNLLISEKGKVGMVIFSMSPDDVREVIKRPYSIIISDSIYPASGSPHPRLYGAFPRVLTKYVREEKILTIEEAVRKMSSMPAKRLRIDKRGQIKEGYHADLLLFHLSEIADNATYENPVQLSSGIYSAFVGGEVVLQNNQIVVIGNGSFLKRK